MKANTPAPVAAVAVAVSTVTLFLGGFGGRLEYPEEPVEYCLASERCDVLTWATSSWVRQFEQVHVRLLASRPSELIERHFMVEEVWSLEGLTLLKRTNKLINPMSSQAMKTCCSSPC